MEPGLLVDVDVGVGDAVFAERVDLAFEALFGGGYAGVAEREPGGFGGHAPSVSEVNVVTEYLNGYWETISGTIRARSQRRGSIFIAIIQFEGCGTRAATPLPPVADQHQRRRALYHPQHLHVRT